MYLSIYLLCHKFYEMLSSLLKQYITVWIIDVLDVIDDKVTIRQTDSKYMNFRSSYQCYLALCPPKSQSLSV